MNNNWERKHMSRSPQPANNPFLESSASTRFPALDEDQYQPSLQSPQSYSSQSVSPSPSHFQRSSYGMQQQQFNQWSGQQQSPGGYNQGGGYAGHVFAPQPSGLGSQPYGGPFPYGAQQPQLQVQTQYTGYPQFQPSHMPLQQQYQQPNPISEFDPYSGLPASPNGLSTPTLVSQPTGQPQRLGPSGQQHPRAFIRSHKVQLDTWNSFSWKQALGTFEELKSAWETRRGDLQKHLYSGQYLTAVDIANIKAMIKQSESNIDAVAASFLQMQEVSESYKHSVDAAGKQRVREALNAGLRDLPDWP
ncbi:hypothetical protein BU17DRAFT_62300 [Hysterangium stoloniferum]|nr:hypothetical protein BU17DRAFT_62300 [Hysterangium stoloniferum]